MGHVLESRTPDGVSLIHEESGPVESLQARYAGGLGLLALPRGQGLPGAYPLQLNHAPDASEGEDPSM